MAQNLTNLRILLASVIELQELIDSLVGSPIEHLIDDLVDLQLERLARLDNAGSGN